MADIVLFHSALGLRPSVRRWAKTLREDGHTVTTPDLFDGQTFSALSDGIALRDRLGIPELSRRAAAAVADLPPSLVYAGFSMGAASAMFLAATRPGARGVFLMHGALPPAALGLAAWPDVPIALHTAEDDPWVPAPIIEALSATAPLELHRYPGGAHLFTDADDPGHHPAHAAAVLAALRAFTAGTQESERAG